LLRVIPRNDIYIRYLNDNRASIGELASELYGRKLRIEVSVPGAAATIASSAEAADAAAPTAAPITANGGEGATRSVAPSPPLAQPVSPASAAAATADSPPPLSIASDRQALYADPVVRRIFEELQGRLVEVRERPPAPSAPPAEAPTPLGAPTNVDPAAPAMRRLSQE
jgi:hypothetical protein